MKCFVVLLCSVFVLVPVSALYAQNANDAAKQALTAAVQSAAIEGEGAAPFRLLAKYETFDFMGRPASSGTLEELFLKPGFRKRTLTAGGSVDKFSPDDEVATVADEAPASGYMERMLADALLAPGPQSKTIETGIMKSKDRKFGTVALNCISLSSAKGSTEQPTATGPSARLYCLDGKAPLLRTSEQQYGLVASYNKLVRFGGHILSEDMTLQQNGRMRGRVQVVSIVAAPELKEGDFPKEMSPAARPQVDIVKGKARVPAGVVAGNIITKITPSYPPDSRSRHISGSVVLHAIIGRDGVIKDLDVISAPAEDMAESAIDAVSQWRYKPYLLNNVATEVDTTITVNYSFH